MLCAPTLPFCGGCYNNPKEKIGLCLALIACPSEKDNCALFFSIFSRLGVLLLEASREVSFENSVWRALRLYIAEKTLLEDTVQKEEAN